MTTPKLRAGLAAGVLTLSSLAAVAVADERRDGDRAGGRDAAAPLIIGHRGASGYRPEHTLAAYELAARQGADYVEPDLVSTKDGVLVARHEPEIGGTTDVADHPEFAGRKTTKVIDGTTFTGWFTEDFTLAELKTLRAKERIPAVRQENTIYDRRFEVPTFDEVLALRERLSRELGREVGVYPETKHPTYFTSIGKPLEPALVRSLERAGLNKRGAPVFVQSFESQLRDWDDALRVPLVRLISGSAADRALLTDDGLRSLSWADGLGPEKGLVTKDVVDRAHRAGKLVHPYTIRAENQFLPADLRSSSDPAAYGRVLDELQRYVDLGVDGVFIDQPDVGVEARQGR